MIEGLIRAVLMVCCLALIACGGRSSNRGLYRAQVERPLSAVLVGFQQHLEGTGAGITDRRESTLVGRLSGTLADGSEFTVRLEWQRPQATEVRIQIGVFGDRARAGRMLREARPFFRTTAAE